MQQPKNKHPVATTDDDPDDEDADDEDQEDDYMPLISRETVEGCLVGIIEHVQEYT